MVAVCRPSHEGRGLKLIGIKSRHGPTGRPSHEGRGLKWMPCAAFRSRIGRPSHEGRGLKSEKNPFRCVLPRVVPLTRDVD